MLAHETLAAAVPKSRLMADDSRTIAKSRRLVMNAIQVSWVSVGRTATRLQVKSKKCQKY